MSIINNVASLFAGSTDLLVALPDGSNQRALNTLQKRKNKELLSVQDFMTSVEYDAWIASPTTADMTRPLQAFFDAIKVKDYGTVYCSGSFAVSAGLTLGGSTGSLTKNIVGNMTLTALGAIDTLLKVYGGLDFKWLGTVATIGVGNTTYASRTCRIGIRMGAEYNSARNVFTALIARRFNQVGVSANNLTTLSNYGDVRVSDCGSGKNLPDYSLTANWTNKVDSGSSGSTQQRSTINVDVLPPAVCETRQWVIINEEIYFIYSVDRTANTLSVFPWIDTTLTSGSLRYLFGAGVYIVGGDASVLRFSKIDAVRCAIGLLDTALYGAVFDNLVTQQCGAAVVIGEEPASAHVGGQINGLYCENNEFDFVRNTRAELGMTIASEYAFNFDKVKYPCGMRLTGNTLSPEYTNLKSVSILTKGTMPAWEKIGFNTSGSTLNLDVTDLNRASINIYANSKTIALLVPNMSLHRAYGFDSARLVISGAATNNGAPTGTMTFNAPTGYTVNGGSTVAYTGFTGAAVFNVQLRVDLKEFVVSCVNSLLQASVTYDPPSLATATQQSTTVTLVGAKLGDNVSVSFSRALNGTRMWAEVTTTNTVTVYHRNDTGATVDLASDTLKVKII